MNHLRTIWSIFIIPVLLFFIGMQAGCGCGTTPPEKAPAAHVSHPKTAHAKIVFDSIKISPDVVGELVKSITAWAAKKGHTIQRDKDGKVVIVSQKGRKVKVPFNVFPPNDQLPKDCVDNMEARVKEWAEKKEYTTGRDKKGRLVGKNAKGKNVSPSFDVFLADLPDNLVSGAAAAPTTTATATSVSGEQDDEPNEDGDSNE